MPRFPAGPSNSQQRLKATLVELKKDLDTVVGKSVDDVLRIRDEIRFRQTDCPKSWAAIPPALVAFRGARNKMRDLTDGLLEEAPHLLGLLSPPGHRGIEGFRGPQDKET